MYQISDLSCNLLLGLACAGAKGCCTACPVVGFLPTSSSRLTISSCSALAACQLFSMYDDSSTTAHGGALLVQDTVALPHQVIRSLWGLLGDGECHGNVTVTYRKLPTGGQPGVPFHFALCAVFVGAVQTLQQNSQDSQQFPAAVLVSICMSVCTAPPAQHVASCTVCQLLFGAGAVLLHQLCPSSETHWQRCLLLLPLTS